MDTIRDQKRRKKESELGLEKSLRGKVTGALENKDDYSIMIKGEVIKMDPALKDLPEIDYDNPQVKKWMAEEEAERIRNYGRLTPQELEYMYVRRPELKKEFPHKTVIELNQMALQELRDKKVPNN